MQRPPEPATPLADSLNKTKTLARDQLSAAWQLQIEMLQEHLSTLLASGWRERIERVFEERFSELTTQVEQQFQAELESRAAQAATAAKTARRELSDQLNRFARRLRNAENHQAWTEAVLDAASGFAQQVALFGVSDGSLKLESARGLTTEPLEGREVPLTAAPAFATAVETLDPVIAMRTAGELSEAIAAMSAANQGAPVQLFPLVSQGKAAAVLYVEAPEGAQEIGALELIASVAASALEVRAAQKPVALVAIAGAGQAPRETRARDWASLTTAEQELHLRAQRFARVQVAAMRLYKAKEVKTGRESGDLYSALREEIDTGREEFRAQFFDATPTMVDYLHLELVKSLANDNAALLGSTYPGPLV